MVVLAEDLVHDRLSFNWSPYVRTLVSRLLLHIQTAHLASISMWTIGRVMSWHDCWNQTAELTLCLIWQTWISPSNDSEHIWLAERVDSIWGPSTWNRPRGCVPMVIGTEPVCPGYLYHATITVPIWMILLFHLGSLCLDPLLKGLGLICSWFFVWPWVLSGAIFWQAYLILILWQGNDISLASLSTRKF